MASHMELVRFNWNTNSEYRILAIASGTAFSGWVVITLLKKIREYNLLSIQHQRIVEKRAEVQKRLSQLTSHLEENGVLVTPERERILNLPVEKLIHDLQEGKLTAVKVLRAFQAKAIEVTRKYNCITEFVWEAESWAEELDRAKAKAPLHGLPVSIKDSFSIAGYDSTLGVPSRLGNPAVSNSVVVETWKQAGAVPFCHTNLPQTTFSYESSNPIWGRTLNPIDPTRSPGGSSSGEAALICAGASLLGIGTDLGGSVRIPAQFCGIVSLRPTHMRISPRGKAEPIPGLWGTTSVPGVMGHDVNCVVAGTRALLGSDVMFKLDPEVVPVPWREEIFSSKRPLRIGYYITLDTVPTPPGCRRAVDEARQALEKCGHTLVPFKFSNGVEETRLFLNILLGDGSSHLNNVLKNDIWDPCIMGMRHTNRITGLYRNVKQWLANLKMPEDERRYYGYPGAFEYIVDLTKRRQLIEYTLKEWERANVDVVLGPTCPFPALKLDAVFDIGSIVYTGMYNLLEMPAGVVPVTTESKEDQKRLLWDYKDDTRATKIIKESTEGAEGLPQTVMIIGRPWQEELVLRVMKDLQNEVSK